ncbi:MAG: creatininase family protein [Alphaproteobacteria bacterium]|nr:creatininase family protein [Alphaproteobacteria bacterium]
MTEIAWERLTAPALRALAARGDALAVLPLGALEQHGPHLPVSTDSRIAGELALRAARLVAAEMPVAVLPSLWTGMSEHHFPFGGTISLDFAALAAVLRSVVRSLRAIGFARLLIVNGHGGNESPLAVIARELGAEFAFPVVATMPWSLVPEVLAQVLERQKGVHHACEAETSVMLALAPELVRTDALDAAAAQGPGAIAQRPAVARFYSFAERAPDSGVRGDPRPASAAKGETMIAAMAEALAAVMRDPLVWRRPDAVWTPGRGLGRMNGPA